MNAHSVLRWLQACVVLAASALLFQHYIQSGNQAISRPTSSDFYKFYISAQRVQQGYSMYWLVPAKLKQGDPCHRDTPADQVHFVDNRPGILNLGGDTPCLGPNLNPPIFMAVMQPLALMPYAWAWWTWAAISTCSLLLAAWVLSGSITETPERRPWRWMWMSLALFAFYPTLANFSLGQVGSMLLLLFTLAWHKASVDRELRSGFWLGLAIGVKPFFIVLLPALLVAKQWRACWMALATAAALSALGCLIYGFDAYQHYTAVANNITWFATNWNGSWFGLFDRYFISKADGGWPATMPLSRTYATICAATTFAMCMWLIRHLSRLNPSAAWDAILAIGLPMTLLITPLGWAYYLPILCISVLTAWRHIPVESINRNALRLSLALPVCMSMVPITIKPSPTPLNPADWYGLDAWYWYTTMALLLCSTACILQRPKQQGAPKRPLK
jgi:hypothetical protein